MFLSSLFEDKKSEFVKKEKPAPKPTNLVDDVADFDKIVKDANYKSCGPGTREWKIIWSTHQELQDEMLAWADTNYLWCPRRNARIAYAICLRIQKEKGCTTCFKQWDEFDWEKLTRK